MDVWYEKNIFLHSFQVSSQSELLVPEGLDHSQLDQTVSQIWSQGEGPVHTYEQGTQEINIPPIYFWNNKLDS